MDYSGYSTKIIKDIIRLRRRIAASGIPAKKLDRNLILGSWNIRSFGDYYDAWSENSGSPKRNLRAMVYIAEVIQHFDVIAIQELKRNTSAMQYLLEEHLGNDWGLLMSDVTAGDKGNTERLAFIYDRRRVQTSGLAGEIVLPPNDTGDPVEQFDRTPYVVGFRTDHEQFSMLTTHIRYGDQDTDRIAEIESIARYAAKELYERAKTTPEGRNLIIMGDFNIDSRGDNPLFKAFTSTGLIVPEQLLNMKTTYGSDPKFYDQIAWFMDGLESFNQYDAGVINFADAVFKELTLRQMSYRVSDHFPLWVAFDLDSDERQIAKILNVDLASPDPFSGVKE